MSCRFYPVLSAVNANKCRKLSFVSPGASQQLLPEETTELLYGTEPGGIYCSFFALFEGKARVK